MKASALIWALLAICVLCRAQPERKPEPDIFRPEWIASYLPAKLLILRAEGPESIQKPFRDALQRLQKVSQVTMVDFPRDQRPPSVKDGESMDGRNLKSGDAGFLVLISQTGKVVAIHVAYATDKDWARETAAMVARTTFDPARFEGRPVPVLVCWRWAFDHKMTIN